ncbi:MAG: ribosome small subunit-dependent GTPase A [Spirochaetia bacterium]|jgi:ribosome biogenesis GTPase|nr:ribosome small subunit-dependent GTPase A [Spirochaetia bacterium]
MSLNLYGWDDNRKQEISGFENSGLVPGRIISSSRGIYSVVNKLGEVRAELSGAFRYKAVSNLEYPVVGDFVLMREEPELYIVDQVLSRRSLLKRKAPGESSEEQILAANMDYVFLVFGMDGGRSFNVRAIERLLTLVWDSGASPVIVLNKADLCEDPGLYQSEADSVSMGVAVIISSAATGQGLDDIRAVLKQGKTGLFIGRSGVGKSALTNALMEELINETGDVRHDDRKGRHTTTSRDMFLLPWGALLIDTPGIREISLTGDVSALFETFSDIKEASKGCRFNDCSHDSEPGCAVQEAIQSGLISEDRYRSYKKHLNEIKYQQRRGDARLEMLEREKWKAIHKEYKNFGSKKGQ